MSPRERQRRAQVRLYATDAQRMYLKRLLDEAFAHRYPAFELFRLDRHHLDRVFKTEASSVIDQLKQAKERGWTQ